MYNSADYPIGADTPQAPWNRTTPKETEFQVLCSQTLSKSFPVLTDNYTPICEKEIDCDGSIVSIMDADTSDIDWKEEFHANDHYTPDQLIQLFKQDLEKILANGPVMLHSRAMIKWLIQECDNWIVDEEEFVED